MKHYLYRLTDPNGKSYVGVTCNFKRRMKEHRRSHWPIGKAIREFGEDNFKIEIEEFNTKELALDKEFELVSLESLGTGELYNQSVGGSPSNQFNYHNPMLDKSVVEKHPNIWSSTNNPMLNPISKQKMIKSQKRKPVVIEGVNYGGVREAARAVEESRQCVVYRLKSSSFPDWNYV
jgi:predicted GIY-YIG superfamily endonuclease